MHTQTHTVCTTMTNTNRANRIFLVHLDHYIWILLENRLARFLRACKLDGEGTEKLCSDQYQRCIKKKKKNLFKHSMGSDAEGYSTKHTVKLNLNTFYIHVKVVFVNILLLRKCKMVEVLS